jgi:pimeloyl-ACP methyl ester carboxylesterase
MPIANVNGVQLFYELSGTGEVPIVFVHGEWVSHYQWNLIVPKLSHSFRVLTYDRRGHSQSQRPPGQGSVRKHVADLAALIEHLGLAPTWIAGNSSGASITLRLASERPELFRGLIAHEPPLFALLAQDPVTEPILQQIQKGIAAVVERFVTHGHAAAAEQFVEMMLGPGTWAQLPPDLKQIYIENAPTFVDDAHDPELPFFEPAWIQAFSHPALLSKGEKSPPTFAPVVAKIAGALPKAEVVMYPGAGHIPHVTHPDAYAKTITAFIRKNNK